MWGQRTSTLPMKPPNPLPSPLRAIAWLTVAAGVIVALCAAWLTVRSLTGIADATSLRHWLRWLTAEDTARVGALLLLAAALNGIGLALRRGRAWARTALEVLCWLGLGYLLMLVMAWVVFGYFGAFDLPQDLPQAKPEVDASQLMSVFAMAAAAALPLALVLRYLRSPAVRAAVMRQ